MALLSACGTTDKKAKNTKARTLDRQGVQALAILGTYLFPREWNESMQVSIARRMFPLEYHGNAHEGKTLIQSKVEFDTGALQRLLSDVKKTTPTFTVGNVQAQPFGKDAPFASDDSGEQKLLSWWKPGKHKDPVFYHWTTDRPGEPKSRIWMQASEETRNLMLVFVRIESE